MSTLKVTNIQATGETASRAVSGVAAAWMNMNGLGTIGLRDSYNTSTILDRGTGLYTQNFTSSMGNTNFAGSGSAQGTDGDDDGINRIQVTNPANASSAYVNTFGSGGSAADVGYVTSIIHGDLA